MASPNLAAVNLPAIVCLEPPGEVWTRLRALLADDCISSEFILTRVSENPAELLALCRRLIPALLVVEEDRLPRIPLVGLRGLIGPNGVQILLFSEKNDPQALEYFFRQGCAGVLSRLAPDQTLLKAVRSMFSGELWLPRTLVSKLAREAFSNRTAPALTRRESEILRLISLGQTNQEIADQCFISRETVRWHIRSLYSKIGVANREDAVRDAKDVLSANVPDTGR